MDGKKYIFQILVSLFFSFERCTLSGNVVKNEGGETVKLNEGNEIKKYRSARQRSIIRRVLLPFLATRASSVERERRGGSIFSVRRFFKATCARVYSHRTERDAIKLRRGIKASNKASPRFYSSRLFISGWMDGWTDGRMEVVILREEGSFNFFVSRVLSNLIDSRGAIKPLRLNSDSWPPFEATIFLYVRFFLQYGFRIDF